MPHKVIKSSNARRIAVSTTVAGEYVIPLGGTGWVVKGSTAKKYAAIANSKTEAVKIARSLAKISGRPVIVFGKNGTIQQRIPVPAQ